MKPGSTDVDFTFAFEAARNVEDVHDQRAVDLHQIQGVIDLARDDADETELLLEVTGGPLAFLTMGTEPEQTIRVSPKQAREVAAKLTAWAAVHDGEDAGRLPALEAVAEAARSVRDELWATRGAFAGRLCVELDAAIARLDATPAPTIEVEPTADTERPLPHLADALSQEGSDPR